MYVPKITVYCLQLVPNMNNWATLHDRPGTPQAKFKKQGKSQSTERDDTQPAADLGQDKSEIKKNLQDLSDLHRITQGPNFT